MAMFSVSASTIPAPATVLSYGDCGGTLMGLTGGTARFRADAGLKYHFTLPPNSPWALESVAAEGKPASPAAGSFLTFDRASNEIRLTVRKR